MRYLDADHVDTGSFYARRPEVGAWYRLAGHAGAVAAALIPLAQVPWLLAGLVLVWLSAWFVVVGTTWRASLVAAILVAAVRLTLAACCHGTPA